MTRILLVEDNAENRDALSRRLLRRGYEVILAVDGGEGLLMAENDQPDLILLDMNLPVLDGWTVARTLKDQPTTQLIPIIALTAHAMAGDRQKTLDAGCDDFHTKPVELTRLLTQIENILAAKETQ